jgi:hypothetical protein
MNGSEKIYIVDRITSKPGHGRKFLELYMQRYAPGARERGMTHEFTLVAPPLGLRAGFRHTGLGPPRWRRELPAGKYSAADAAHDLAAEVRRAAPKVSGHNGQWHATSACLIDIMIAIIAAIQLLYAAR